MLVDPFEAVALFVSLLLSLFDSLELELEEDDDADEELRLSVL